MIARRRMRMRTDRAAQLIRRARLDIGMSQDDLARSVDVPRSVVSAYEGGRAHPSSESLQRILRALRLRPSIPLTLYADAIREAAGRFHLSNVRVFGSVLRGEDTEDSDIDLLVAMTDSVSLFDLGAFALAVEEITGFPVDLLTDDQTHDRHFAHVQAQAVPL
ncbi:helix-turn-helix domain-containing protein [Curtobacterium sp. VKM Ac-1395]|uniref:helix-turn-helix domain-containing protein n=1 Tax=Curtobacterium sp. VKM Ac-1395 TaxID=2783815 RepID=UPI002B268C95|nr:helix-turn-helix domain-containing protein [Curtobacterium sp. VKM Ac-1395]